MNLDDFRQRLLEREDARRRLAAIAQLGDALISPLVAGAGANQ
jgi:hypothetical protein